jgi:chemotaxis signal transduction protein
MAPTPGLVSPALPTLPDTPPALRACLFALDGSRFAIDVRGAREVAVFDEITTVPRAPRHVIGVANLRGAVIPIVDIRAALGSSGPRPSRSVRTLVLRDGALLAAIVVDAVLGLEPFEEIVPVDSPATARLRAPRQLMAGWLSWAGETLPLLDVPRMLAAVRITSHPGGPGQGGSA